MYFDYLQRMQWTTVSSKCNFFFKISSLKWHSASLKEPDLLLSALLFPLLVLLFLPSTFSSSLRFTFAPRSCTFSSLNLFTPLIFCMHFSLLLFYSCLLHSSINNPPLLKQSHIVKYCSSYHIVIFTINYVTATPITRAICHSEIKRGAFQIAYFCFLLVVYTAAAQYAVCPSCVHTAGTYCSVMTVRLELRLRCSSIRWSLSVKFWITKERNANIKVHICTYVSTWFCAAIQWSCIN